MPYSHKQQLVDESPSMAPFEPPVNIILNSLSLLLENPKFRALESILSRDFEEADDLRAEILVNSNQFTSAALNHILDEIDRAIDDYRRSLAYF